MAKPTKSARGARCGVCGCKDGCTIQSDCEIAGRIYVNSLGQVVGVSPPCPSTEPAKVRFDIVDAYWLTGWMTDEKRQLVMNQDQGERHAAINFAKVLGVHGKDLRSTGLREDDNPIAQIVGGDEFWDACRSYCVPDLLEDGE